MKKWNLIEAWSSDGKSVVKIDKIHIPNRIVDGVRYDDLDPEDLDKEKKDE